MFSGDRITRVTQQLLATGLLIGLEPPALAQGSIASEVFARATNVAGTKGIDLLIGVTAVCLIEAFVVVVLAVQLRRPLRARSDRGAAAGLAQHSHQEVSGEEPAEREALNLTARLFNSQEQERRRIARELHDVTAQNLFAISINIGQLRRQDFARRSEPARLLEECEWLCEQSLQEIRTLSYLLHPPLLDEAGLVSALQWYVEGFTRRTGIFVDLIVFQNINRLESEVETTLFRIVQESLTNIRRHSGSETASIRLEQQADEMILEIRDRGRGILSGEGRGVGEEIRGLGVGIPGMRQRLHQLGGRLEIESNNEGTTVIAVVPLSQATRNGVQVEDEGDFVRAE